MPPSHVKHHACSLASQNSCLFLSPNSLPIHLDAVYSLYISHALRDRTNPQDTHMTVPLQAVTVVNAEDYYRLHHYRFDNDEIDLHAGLLMPTPGSFLQEHIASRNSSRRWLKQMAVLTPDFAHGDDTADGVWSAWMNNQPEMVCRIVISKYLAHANLTDCSACIDNRATATPCGRPRRRATAGSDRSQCYPITLRDARVTRPS